MYIARSSWWLEAELFRCLDDVDDEVRDRAAMYLKIYQEPPLAVPYIKEGLSAHMYNPVGGLMGLSRIVLLAFCS